MDHSVTWQEIADEMQKDHPFWNKDAVKQNAQELLDFLDPRLMEPLYLHIREGLRADFKHGEFSIVLIQAMQGNCSYLDALSLMDGYLKDPRFGKAMIMRRRN